MASYPLGIDIIIKGLGGLSQVEKAVNRIDKQGASLANTFRILRGAFIALGGTAVAGALLNIIINSEKARISLNALAGSAIGGGKAFETASKFAKEFGFSQEDALKATQELLRVGGLENLNKNLQQAAGVSRSFGIDLKTAADQLAIAKDQGIGSSKQLYEGLKTQYGKIVDTVKDSATLSAQFLEEVLGPNSPAMTAASDGADGVQAAFERLKGSFASFGLEITGTDYAGNINALAEALDYATKNVEKLEFALGILLLAIPGIGWIRAITGVGLALDGIRRNTDKAAESQKNLDKVVQEGSVLSSYNLGMTIESVKKLQLSMSLAAAESKKVFVPTEPTYYQQVLAGVKDAWTQIKTEQETVALMTRQVVVGAYNAVGSAATTAFTSILNGSAKARDAGRQLGQVIINEILNGLVKLYIVAPIMRFITGLIDEQIKKFQDEKRAIDSTNSSLQKQIGLKLLLMALGFEKGGPVQAGGSTPLKFKASGGITPGRMPYIVGEAGPEMFVPNNSGTIIPNNRLGSGSGEQQTGGGRNANVTFNINTLDARDFDNLLTTRQDLIISLINRGLTERGKARLV